MQVNIATRSTDILSLALLLIELDKIHHQAAPDKFPLLSLDKRKNDIQKILDEGHIFYAENNCQIVGFASLMQKKNVLMIEHLFVAPEYRLKKIGTQIVKKIFEEFKGKEIFASVYAFNKEAIEFYNKTFVLSSLIFKHS